ncbi:MAG: hypothetical protein E7282_02610 [Lachnospiraceae bacterium]|nr:hypothetical protein [Lachnospiraceae bacterium]
MKEKSTTELFNILGSTHPDDYQIFLQNNQDSMSSKNTSFYNYIKDLIAHNQLTLQRVFLDAEIPERYGYKLLSGEKHTSQRDTIIRICYAAKLTVDETQRALKKYGMRELYAKDTRDALLILMFQNRPGRISDINRMLKENAQEELRPCGTTE